MTSELGDISQSVIKERAGEFARMLLNDEADMSQFSELVRNTMVEVAFLEGDGTSTPIGILSCEQDFTVKGLHYE